MGRSLQEADEALQPVWTHQSPRKQVKKDENFLFFNPNSQNICIIIIILKEIWIDKE